MFPKMYQCVSESIYMYQKVSMLTRNFKWLLEVTNVYQKDINHPESTHVYLKFLLCTYLIQNFFLTEVPLCIINYPCVIEGTNVYQKVLSLV